MDAPLITALTAVIISLGGVLKVYQVIHSDRYKANVEIGRAKLAADIANQEGQTAFRDELRRDYERVSAECAGLREDLRKCREASATVLNELWKLQREYASQRLEMDEMRVLLGHTKRVDDPKQL